MGHSPPLEKALVEFRIALGQEHVRLDPSTVATHEENTTGVRRSVPAVLYPGSREDVQAIVRIASRFRVPLYPISTGNNWGYGSATPMREGCVVVNLSRMDRITAFDPATGVVTVEPGVTQKTLREFLDRDGHPYLVPTTGAGPSCSVLGNALERGFGLTPYSDHFEAVTAVEAVLPDSTLYASPLDGAFKWGVGPYLDGLFSQSNFGIVTRMSLALAPVPQCFRAFFFNVADPARLDEAVGAVHRALRDVGCAIGGINLMNAARVVALSERCPGSYIEQGRAIPSEELNAMARHLGAGAWTGVGTLFGAPGIARGARREIRRRLKGSVDRLVFVSPAAARGADRLMRALPGLSRTRLGRAVCKIGQSLEVLSGKPSEIALPVAYWRSLKAEVPGSGIDPDQGDAGLLWYAPILPPRGKSISEWVTGAERICREHGFDPLITLTGFNARFFEATLPILFNRGIPGETERAHACYRALFEFGAARGALPYRSGLQGSALAVDPAHPHWRLQARLKQSLDPAGLFSPGRYSIDHPAPEAPALNP